METVYLMVSILPALTDTVRVILPLHGCGGFFKASIVISAEASDVPHFNTVCKVLRRGFRLNGYN